MTAMNDATIQRLQDRFNALRPPTPEADDEMERAADELVAHLRPSTALTVVVEPTSEVDRRIAQLTADIEHQEGRMAVAQASLKAELAKVKAERVKLRERETAARMAYSTLVGLVGRLADGSRAALKELEG